jgi:hypothetical protein
LIGCHLDPWLVWHLLTLGELLLKYGVTSDALILLARILFEHGSLGHSDDTAPLAGPLLVR